MTTKPKDTAELVEALIELAERSDIDTEERHIRADDLLLEHIGSCEVSKAFNDLDKWYA